jgi:hypothetical protein
MILTGETEVLGKAYYISPFFICLYCRKRLIPTHKEHNEGEITFCYFCIVRHPHTVETNFRSFGVAECGTYVYH